MINYFTKLIKKKTISNILGFPTKDIKILEFINVPSNIVYILHKPTHFIFEMSEKDEKLIVRNVTFSFNWIREAETDSTLVYFPIQNKLLPKEYTFLEKCIFIFVYLFGNSFN